MTIDQLFLSVLAVRFPFVTKGVYEAPIHIDVGLIILFFVKDAFRIFYDRQSLKKLLLFRHFALMMYICKKS